MRKQWKRTVALFMAGGMLLSAAACGSRTGSETATNTSDVSGEDNDWSKAEPITWDVYESFTNY